MRFKRKLSLLLVMAMVVSLLAGMTASAAAENTNYLAFTSDVHYDTSYEQNNLDVWLNNLQDMVDNVDYLGICGDLGSAYASTPEAYWDYTQVAMDTTDSYVDSGFITNGGIYTLGNHEWYPDAGGDYANYKDHPTAQKFIEGEAAKTDAYVIYSFGAAETSKDHGQDFLPEDIAALEAYLETAPTDIPIIIMTHFPLHSFSSRTSANADMVVNLLNNYPNVIYLWGHNHSVYDSHYDKVFIAGESIEITEGNMMNINFTYASAGCMADSEYNRQSASIKGKGLLLALNGWDATFTYYDIEGNPLGYNGTVDISEAANVNVDGPFTVKFKDGYDGTILDVQTVEKGGSATAPDAPAHEGYTFIEWSKEFDNITDLTTVTAMYEEDPEAEEPLAEQAELDKNYVYLSLSVGDEAAVGKSGTPIVLYPVPFTEGMTVVDAVTKLHEMEYEGGTDGIAADNPYGFYNFSKIWGLEPEYGALAFDSENYLDAGVEAKGGEVYHFLAYESTWLTTSLIAPVKTETVTGKFITMQAKTMSMNSDYTYSAIGYPADIYAGSSLNNMTDTGINSDEEGCFTISFDKPGTYYVMARNMSDAYGNGIAMVEVTENSGKYAYVNLSIDGEVMYDKDGNYIAYYPMVLEEGDTINDIMTELHAYAYGRGSAWSSYDSGFTFVAGVWGLYNESNCGNIYLNNSDAPVSATTVLKDGDVLDINGYSDFVSYAYYRAAMFDKKHAEIAVGEEITLTANRSGLNMSTFEYDSKPNASSPIYIDFKKTDYVTDSNGQVTLSFGKDGTYIITGGTTPSSTCPVSVIKVGTGGSMVKAQEKTINVSLSSQNIKVNDVETAFEAYNIDGYNYFKLRDIAYVLNGTGSQFSVDYDETERTISCIIGNAYTAGGELVTGEDKSATAEPSTWKLLINGNVVELTVFNIGGHNYYKLRDLGEVLNFEVEYEDTTNTGFINSVE